MSEAIAAKDFDKAMSLRDPEVREALEGFYATSEVHEQPRLPHHTVSCCLHADLHLGVDPSSQRMRIAIMQCVPSLSILCLHSYGSRS